MLYTEDPGLVIPNPPENLDPAQRNRVANQLKRCLNAITSDPDQAALRKNCCLDWPKPCSYHEGYLDGYEAATTPKDTRER